MFGGDQLDDDYAPWSKTKVEQSNDSERNLDHPGLMAEIDCLNHRIAVMKNELQMRHAKDTGDVWYWQGDGSDNPGSMSNSMIVVINAADLRAALANQPAPLDADEMTRVRRLMKALGHADAFEEPDEYVRGILCTLLGQASGELERANQPAPTVPAAKYEQRPRHENGMPLEWVALDVDTDEEADARMNYGERGEWRRVVHQPAQEQASTTRVTETKRTQLEARGYEVVGYVMQNSMKELCTLTHGRVEWLKS
jgi:hypothetical protein